MSAGDFMKAVEKAPRRGDAEWARAVQFTRSTFRNGWTTFNVRSGDADEAELRLAARSRPDPGVQTMIKLTSIDGRAVYVVPRAVVGIQESPPSWGIPGSILCLAGGMRLEVQQSPAEVAEAIGKRETFDEWHQAKFGRSFETRAFEYPATPVSEMVRMLARDLRDYVSDSVAGGMRP